ncbi:hypothetical protein Atai01_04320 [Amycolatopsis taiwanensis]|uniref:Uncharacterized protein n=2 Tax=Amycolatopsis taiwanensis TaxID=342230 RepID=A0A9W6QU72_9PSEU|nr:hypothetical protein Atai01_04320 [Amycolatopsis taiwanensis]
MKANADVSLKTGIGVQTGLMSHPSSRTDRHLRVVPDQPVRRPDPVAVGRDLLGRVDPWDAERAAASYLADAEGAGRLPRVWTDDIPALERAASRGALAMLLAVGSVAGDERGEPASAAAGRLTAAGVRPPPWAGELSHPIEALDAWRLCWADGLTSALNCTFHRAARSHSLVVLVDHLDGDIATDILEFDDSGLAETIGRLAARGQVTLETPGQAVVRADMEQALRTRAERDRTGVGCRSLGAEITGGEVPGFPAMTWLLRARLPHMGTRYAPRPNLSLLSGESTKD